MRILFLALIAVSLFGCYNNQKKSDQNENAAQQVVNEDVSTVEVSSLLADAEAYDGKEVFLTGTVVHVCKHSGKRLHLMAADEKTKIRIEAGDIGKFDRELEGSNIIAKGIFRREVIDEAYLAKWAGELGKEGEHKSHEEQEEEKGKMKKYREMMKETEDGYLENFWVDGISFETVEEEVAI